MSATRYLYLSRHARADPGGNLTEEGCRQAVLLGERLREAGVEALYHGPLPRALRTARLAAERTGVDPVELPEAGDYVPHLPVREEVPSEYADSVLDFVASRPEEERGPGPELGRRALERFTGPVEGGRDLREAVITHAYLVGWIVSAALGAPAWRWTALAPGNAALTVIRYAPGRPASVLMFNDTSHLGPEPRRHGSPPPHP